MTHEDRRKQLHRHATRYEIAAEIDGARFLLGYRRLVSRRSLLELAQAHGDVLVEHAGEGDPSYSTARGWSFGPVRVFKTGRTERSALTEGELPSL